MTSCLMGVNYYAIIPANVRYADMPPNAKLLYGEITALATKEGYCWASDGYFAELYGVSRQTINLWIRNLRDFEFIFVDTIKDETGTKRKIRIGDVKEVTGQTGGVSEKPDTGVRKRRHPCQENPTHSNTMNNTNNISTKVSISFAPKNLENPMTENPSSEQKQKNRAEEIESFFTLATTDPKAALLSIGISDPVLLEKILGDFQAFIEHWIEPNIRGDKVRWQSEKTFDPTLRFKKWMRNKIAWSKDNKQTSRTSEVFTTTI